MHWIGSATDLLCCSKHLQEALYPAPTLRLLGDQICANLCVCVCVVNMHVCIPTLMIAWWVLIRVSLSIILSWSSTCPLSSLRRPSALDSVSVLGFVPWPASEELNTGSLVTADNLSLITSGTSWGGRWSEPLCSDKRFTGFGSRIKLNDKNTSQAQQEIVT